MVIYMFAYFEFTNALLLNISGLYVIYDFS